MLRTLAASERCLGERTDQRKHKKRRGLERPHCYFAFEALYANKLFTLGGAIKKLVVLLLRVACCAAAVYLNSHPSVASNTLGLPYVRASTDVEAGRYLVVMADCHTPGWGRTGGKTPVTQWLTGSKMGFRGP